MHILFLTDNFPPEVNAPASRTFEHCQEWVKSGHYVTVITGAPNFPKGRVFDGYANKLWQSETMCGIRVIRVWTYMAANEGVVKRIVDYISFMITGFLASLFVRQVDVIVGTSPQFFTVCAAYMSSCLKKVPWAFELRDIWPESIRVVGAIGNSKWLDLLERLELFLYRQADIIIAVTHDFRAVLTKRGINSEKIKVITNGVDMARFLPVPKDEELVKKFNLEGKFVAGYIGTHGLAHALDTILETAALMRTHGLNRRFVFLFLGDGASKIKLQQFVVSNQLDNVLFIDSVPKDEVVRYWSLLDVSVIHLKKDPLFLTVIPSKLFESMGMGIPIAHGVRGESEKIVKHEGVGICFEPENPYALMKALQQLGADPELYLRLKTNGPAAAARYDRSVLAKQMLDELEYIVVRGGGGKRNRIGVHSP